MGGLALRTAHDTFLSAPGDGGKLGHARRAGEEERREGEDEAAVRNRTFTGGEEKSFAAQDAPNGLSATRFSKKSNSLFAPT